MISSLFNAKSIIKQLLGNFLNNVFYYFLQENLQTSNNIKEKYDSFLIF